MNEFIQMIHRSSIKGLEKTPLFTVAEAKKARAFHRSFPEYAPTPLVRLKGLAEALGTAEIFVKDESKRFGLNAFKVLGGSYGVGCYLGEELGIPEEEFTYSQLTGREIRERLKGCTLVTATDGNHGRGVAWTASKLRMNSVVYMPKGSSLERLNHIKMLGAEASITDLNYDDAVRLACGRAEEKGWILVQDTAWEDYERIPTYIMKGYTTMALEAVEQLGDIRPTHIFLQAGVGAMAGALTGFFADYYGDEVPVICVVEPSVANCIFRTAQAEDGALHAVKGSLNTIMAGLACGEPCSIGWDMLDAYALNFFSVPDEMAVKGMRLLGNPIGKDEAILSGESGAVSVGLVAEIMKRRELFRIREALGLDETSKILCFSTEGDTDRENYLKIVGNRGSLRL